MKLRGQNAIITGSSTGLGYSIAQAFLAEGANVAICGRDRTALALAGDRLTRATKPGQLVLAIPCDVTKQDQVNSLAQQALAAFGSIDILVNNAGVLGPIGRSEDVDLADWRETLETNFFGVLFCCLALLPHFRQTERGKIINVSGGGAASSRPFFSAYATSKAAVVRLTENLAEELRGSGVEINAVAPGPLNTRMLDRLIAAGPLRVGQHQFEHSVLQKEQGGSSIEDAVALCLYLASSQSNGITGRLISAVWDRWVDLHKHLGELQSSDIYTLRRIVPEDRGSCWT